MKDLRKNLPKPIRIIINFILGLSFTFIVPYTIAYLWLFLSAFLLMEPVDDAGLIKSITNYNIYPRLLTLAGIIIGFVSAFADYSKRYKKYDY